MAKPTVKKDNLSAEKLKNVLWETLNQVKTGNMDVSNADAIATQAREIIRTTNTQLRVASQSKREVPANVLSFSEGE